MKTLILTLLISFCYAQVNLRSGYQMNTLSQCQKPCFLQKDKLFKGAAIGFPAYSNKGYYYTQSTIYENDMLYLCCDQQRTFDFLDGLIVPDFVDVKKLNLDDLNQIEVSIRKEDNPNQFKIQISHHFQRVAFQVSSNRQPYANMTTVLQKIDPNSCPQPKFSANWNNIYLNLGVNVITSMYIGGEFDINFYLSTSKDYTKEEITNIYWQHIQNNTIQSLCKYFEGCEYVSSDGWTRGIEFLRVDQSFQMFLKSIDIQNYEYQKPSKEFNIQNDITVLNSYYLFNEESSSFQECSLKQWKQYKDRFYSTY
ncbi:hypothetical protein TTHERM_00073150 (macronuclear) [Tetrahymena thermophila SB210]|uniref:Transmembrane protein n=1 Tax=Tetrahymena thermophila (strain SB210) TaxID=312017 RepID=Q23GF1_TETTS|nr:hypothetical protein TTHERM_00073150 [Tetrahymena thermophila SB210]EAR95309.1 hypothetical protein TTHERM_00073150 [Tetrahymena thermophila SB210]|eukprot:XP_001015554.1 hypothetical protein TTHERM_00073150 [Tetrahymena thermophila SB210]